MLFELFHVDALAITMICLVGFISMIILSFSKRYMQGDAHYATFYIYMVMLVCSLVLTICTDHLLLFTLGWGLNNLLLVKLMSHKSGWRAARNSAKLAGVHFLLGFMFLATAFSIITLSTGLSSIQQINAVTTSSNYLVIAKLLLITTAMTQSAIWPFHKWLLSSLNSPTPVSALMHAGLVNGGGFLLLRFAPFLSNSTSLLPIVFAVGLITAIAATAWKLIQSDIKRMLACSTAAQMGFMFVQCGLGLYSAALAHIIWHGMFKANLFLGSVEVAKKSKQTNYHLPNVYRCIYALALGVVASYSFSVIHDSAWLSNDTTMLQDILVLIVAIQVSLNFLQFNTKLSYVIAAGITLSLSTLYAVSVNLFEGILGTHGIDAQPLNTTYIVGIAVFVVTWLLGIYLQHADKNLVDSTQKLYVKLLNSSQPHPKTITAYRNHYDYL